MNEVVFIRTYRAHYLFVLLTISDVWANKKWVVPFHNAWLQYNLIRKWIFSIPHFEETLLQYRALWLSYYIPEDAKQAPLLPYVMGTNGNSLNFSQLQVTRLVYKTAPYFSVTTCVTLWNFQLYGKIVSENNEILNFTKISMKSSNIELLYHKSNIMKITGSSQKHATLTAQLYNIFCWNWNNSP